MRYLLSMVACMLLLQSASAASHQESWPDGSKKAEYRLNRDGERHGRYTLYYEGGKQRAEVGEYRQGVLHGMRSRFAADGRLLAEETWFEGRLLFPHSPREIVATRKLIEQEAAAAVAAMSPPTYAAVPSSADLSAALARLRTYRFLVGVAYEDITYRDEYLTLAQGAAEISAANGSISHSPKRPQGWSDEQFDRGFKGAKESNLSMGRVGAASIDLYMDDSDPSNISRVGHRRWLINPAMLQTGIGIQGRFSAAYAFDNGRKDIADYDFISFPPPGYMPTDLFSTHYAWHISVNPAHYHKPDSKVTLDIYPVNKALQRAAEPLVINYRNVDTGGFGIPNAVIARPENVAIRKGATYEVVVRGLKPKNDNKSAEITYYVSFF